MGNGRSFASSAASPLQMEASNETTHSKSLESELPSRSQNEPAESSRKRKRTAAIYSRKRAVIACQTCRVRKIKCNNARPACGSCTASGSHCTYDDPSDISSYDPASIQILDRLGQVLTRLDQLPAVLGIRESRLTNAPHTSPLPFPGGNTSPEINLKPDDAEPTYDQLQIPSSTTKPDTILQWPIFENCYPADYITDASLVAELGEESDDDLYHIAPRRTRSGPNLADQDAILALVRRFLSLVHVKNPILDPDTLLDYAHAVAEDGPQWDAPSCIVLLACALGCVAKDYGLVGEGVASASTSLQADNESLRKGQVYFDLARRRLGSLTKGVLAAQSHFLAGVYLMYRLRPLSAWIEFHSATRAYYLYLQYRARQPSQSLDDAKAEERRRLEQRLYWSCYKSECELRAEMDVPNSLLADLPFPDSYPSPPDISGISLSSQISTNSHTVNSASPETFNKSEDLSRIYEQSWFYYLTEITIRRIFNRVLNLLYSNGTSLWVDQAVPSMVEMVVEFEQRLEDWYESLPTPIQFHENCISSQELPEMVHGRFLELKCWIYRPFLYYTIHSPTHAPHQRLALPYVNKLLTTCAQILRHDLSKHRHHGTWFATRSNIAAALLILAAARSDTVPVPTDWQDILQTGLEKLRYWADEACGTLSAVQVIENLMSFSPREREDLSSS